MKNNHLFTKKLRVEVLRLGACERRGQNGEVESKTSVIIKSHFQLTNNLGGKTWQSAGNTQTIIFVLPPPVCQRWKGRDVTFDEMTFDLLHDDEIITCWCRVHHRSLVDMVWTCERTRERTREREEWECSKLYQPWVYNITWVRGISSVEWLYWEQV